MMENLKPDFKKQELIPAIVQHHATLQVLMLGYMNLEAFNKTLETKKVSFFSRSKNRLWVKGEESGNFLIVKDIKLDCDKDTLLIQAEPVGVTCHTGTYSCFGEKDNNHFLYELEKVIDKRIAEQSEESYTVRLSKKGINKIAQKVGEEAVELVIEAKDDNEELFLNEAADLLFHILVLLKTKKVSLEDVSEILAQRNQKKS